MLHEALAVDTLKSAKAGSVDANQSWSGGFLTPQCSHCHKDGSYYDLVNQARVIHTTEKIASQTGLGTI